MSVGGGGFAVEGGGKGVLCGSIEEGKGVGLAEMVVKVSGYGG